MKTFRVAAPVGIAWTALSGIDPAGAARQPYQPVR
jgi:hypothetical protein